MIRSCAFDRVPGAVDAALLCISQSCMSGNLQSLLLDTGVLGYVAPLLFNFDETEEEELQETELPPPFSSVDENEVNMGAVVLALQMDNAKMQRRKNYHAMLAVHVLGR